MVLFYLICLRFLFCDIKNREFSNERERVERQEHFRKMRIRKLFTEDFLNYFDWISTAGKRTVFSTVFSTYCFQYCYELSNKLRNEFVLSNKLSDLSWELSHSCLRIRFLVLFSARNIF